MAEYVIYYINFNLRLNSTDIGGRVSLQSTVKAVLGKDALDFEDTKWYAIQGSE